MSCQAHQAHSHTHGDGCGHTSIQHDGHTDYVHDGHLHSQHGNHYDEHRLSVSDRNPGNCAPIRCDKDGKHIESMPHGDHTDYMHEGRLHYRHGDHCDDHGSLSV